MTHEVQINVPLVPDAAPGYVGEVGTLPTKTRMTLCRVACGLTERGIRLGDTGAIDTPTQVIRYFCEQIEAAEQEL